MVNFSRVISAPNLAAGLLIFLFPAEQTAIFADFFKRS